MRGGAVPLRLLRPVPASAPGSWTLRREGEGAAGPEPGISDSARSRGLATELRCGRAALLPRL